ncbi:hypothetical protein GCM10009654_58310 [Streptomyces hebeiensis]|uniref:Uncharacterized protein n=1 Tax=Streptomyces hebeiensis TaxID=229486 RepID=A0ABN1V655_9ACTN
MGWILWVSGRARDPGGKAARPPVRRMLSRVIRRSPPPCSPALSPIPRALSGGAGRDGPGRKGPGTNRTGEEPGRAAFRGRGDGKRPGTVGVPGREGRHAAPDRVVAAQPSE